MKGGFILLGVLVLCASIIGVKWLMEHSAETAKAKSQEEIKPPDYVVCWGHFDVEQGIAALSPRQVGDVALVVSENKKVEKGEVLLRLDDRMAQLKVEQAQAAADAAKLQVDEARLLVDVYKEQVIQQRAAVAGIGEKVKVVQYEFDTRIKSLDPGSAAAKNEKKKFDALLAQLGENKKAEEAKLRQIQLQNAELKIAQAEADVKVKQALIREAKDLLEYYKIVAPSDGEVLRVYIHKGETYTPTSRGQAIDFKPAGPIIVRAEVLQEWGRYVKPGQLVEIVDDTYNGPSWKGTMNRISGWYDKSRSPVIEPFRYNDVRTLECVIDLKDDDGAKKYIGQRIRAKIKI